MPDPGPVGAWVVQVRDELVETVEDRGDRARVGLAPGGLELPRTAARLGHCRLTRLDVIADVAAWSRPAAEVEVSAHDYGRAGKPECDWTDLAAREQLVSSLVGDALTVLAAVEEVEVDAAQAEAVGLLALVAGQDVKPVEDEGSWRIARPTVKDRVISTVDPESRHVHKNQVATGTGSRPTSVSSLTRG